MPWIQVQRGELLPRSATVTPFDSGRTEETEKRGSMSKKTPAKGRYIRAWADLRKEEEMLWVEEGEDPNAVVEHWFNYGDVCGYGFDEVDKAEDGE